MMEHGAKHKPKGTVNIVVDLETINTKPHDPAIIQVGIAALLPDGSTTYWQGTCRYSVLGADQATWDWWHDPERVELLEFLSRHTKYKYPTQKALLAKANSVIAGLRKDYDVMVWGNSPTFDLTPFHILLGSANLAWTYRDERDMRTMRSIYNYECIPSELSWRTVSAIGSALSVSCTEDEYPLNRLVRHNAAYDAALELEQLRAMAQQLEYGIGS
jgi:hypothetical protein